MQEYDKTTRLSAPRHISQGAGQVVTIFDACRKPYTVSLSDLNQTVITFGRDSGNDIVLSSQIVSRHHGRFLYENGQLIIEDGNSKNGLIYHDHTIL